MSKYPFRHNTLSFSHIKASPYLDHTRKVDFITNIVPKNNPALSVGVQLTTQHSKLNPFNKNFEKEEKKKRKIVMANTTLIAQGDGVIDTYPSVMQPDITAYMIVNGSINEMINMQKNNIFQNYF